MSRPVKLYSGLLVLILGGCAVGPNYHRPPVNAPPSYRSDEGTKTAASLADLPWWEVFGDEPLRDLIHTALQDGFDARIAAARVEQARALAAEARGQLFPALGYAANADRGRSTQFGNPYVQGNGTTANGFDGYIAAAWELDLWGRVRRLNESARAQYLATEESRRAVLISLVSQVATAYFDLLALDAQRAVAVRATDSFNNSLKLFNRRLQGGVASRLESSSAAGSAAVNAARVPDLERMIALKENQLAALLGRNPGPVPRGTPLGDRPSPPNFPVGIPSQLLERRPDVLQAEENVRAANANIGLTVGGFLPRIGLSALAGGVSPNLDQVTSHHAALWSIGAQATGPLFQGGGLYGQYDAVKAAAAQARLQYEQTALNAFREVADALISRQKYLEVAQQEKNAVDAFQDAVKIATQRYESGDASYFEVLNAQQQLFPAETALAQAQHDELVSVVQLYRALGGGWNLPDASAWINESAPK